MIRLTGLVLPLDAPASALASLAAARLRVPESSVLEVTLVRRSVDARDKGDVHFVATVDVSVQNEAAVLRRLKPSVGCAVHPEPAPVIPRSSFALRPVVVGAGPAGLFAALTLAQSGARPILIERGRDVDSRTQDVSALQKNGVLDPDSNVQFGEGGAGAFSDGKLTTGTRSPWQRHVLETFVRHGAPEEILWLHKPHIGTDRLKGVVASIRREIIRLGGTVHFSACLTELLLTGAHISGIRIRTADGTRELQTDCVLLCIGHSARDTVQSLFRSGVRMVQKPFAIGVRIEHPQTLIDHAQYGRFAGHPALRAADYKLNVHTPDGRGVYTFCMCPGGEVIAAASQPGGVAVNGMSFHARDGINANAALLVGIRTEDFQDDHPLAGFVLQRRFEQAAYRAGGGDFRAPVQRVEDFLAGRPSSHIGDVIPTYRPGFTPADLRACLPDYVIEDLKLGIAGMDRQLHGFAHPDAILTGVETRSSSPVRMVRGKDGVAEGIRGLFPAGEGAGYAGGIMSAAVDGIGAALNAVEQSRLI